MIRIATIFLCLLLAGAAAGRYRAEVSVRETRSELQQLENTKIEEERTIQMLRAETAFLENPERLSKIADAKTTLRPSARSQILSAREFAAVFGDKDDALPSEPAPIDTDIIFNALAMASIPEAE